jgi:[acyl-carrier-protein] S-malonyltransferase
VPNLAFTFPGQGSQRPAMGAPWQGHPAWDRVGEASDAAGDDVSHLLLEAGDEELRQTDRAQLATFVLGLVALDAARSAGLAPTACAGHSLGEYTALVAAGALDPDEGVRLVAARGAAMHAAAEANPGTMAAVLGLDDVEAEAACRQAGGDVWVANRNGPGQVVIAGTAEAVAGAGAAAKERGARKVLPLPVAGAFHTPLMAPAADDLDSALGAAAWRPADVPVVTNVDALPHTEAAGWRPLLGAQLCRAVRWRESVARLAEYGADTFVELGPGGVLTGLVRRIVPGARAMAVSSPADLDALLAEGAGAR